MAEEHLRGQWMGVQKAPGDAKDIGDGEGVVGVHAVMLHTGKVLLWNSRYEGLELLYAAWTWDPRTGAASEDLPFNGVDSTGPWQPGSDIDIFCAHHVVLEDGRVMVLGGASGLNQEGLSHGADGVWIFDPEQGDDGEWAKIADMANGRWYPTPVMMPDGSVVVFSGWEAAGLGGASRRIVASHERMRPPGYRPEVVSGGERALFIFPGMHLVKGGKVFHIQTSWRYTPAYADLVPTSSFEIDPDGKGQWLPYSVSPNQPVYPEVPLREEGTSVLLPPAGDGRILVVGGGYVDLGGTNDQVAQAQPDSWEILDTQSCPPAWTHRGKLRVPRVNVNSVLLPDARVLIFGGHNNYRGKHSPEGRAMKAELFDPVAAMADPDGYRAVETEEMGVSRMYHSTGVLLPDGSVMTAGGFDMHLDEPDDQPAQDNHRNIEIYQPPYFFNGIRPKVHEVKPKEVVYGASLEIRFESDTNVQSVVLMRPNSMTHHTDSGQRLVPLAFKTDGDVLRATMESDASVAPPGYYMLFIVDSEGRPCEEAPFVRIPLPS